jgi:hypothetical protein
MKKRQRKSGKGNITIIYKKIFRGNISIDIILIISNITIFYIDHLDKLLLLILH